MKKTLSFLKKICIATSLLTAAFISNADDFVVDGCFGCGGETYDIGFAIDYDGFDEIGYLAFGQGVDGQYMYLKMSEGFVDSTFGTNANAGYGGGGRSFEKIISSDALGKDGTPLTFSSTDSGIISDKIEVTIDLMSCVNNAAAPEPKKKGKGKGGDDACKNYAEGNEYESAGYSQKDDGAYIKSDGSIGGGDPSEIFGGSIGGKDNIVNSLDYNIANVRKGAGDTFDTSKSYQSIDSEAADYEPNWLMYIGYEFKFTKNVFNLAALQVSEDGKSLTDGITTMLLPSSHASPPLAGDNTPTTTVSNCPETDANKCLVTVTDIPEPTSLAIFGLGIVGLVLSRRKLKLI